MESILLQHSQLVLLTHSESQFYMDLSSRIIFLETSLAVQWLRLRSSIQGAQVQFLVRALRSHMLHRMTLMLGKIEGRRGDN